MKYRAKAKIFGITYHQISVKTHWSIEKIEQYYLPIRQAYDTIEAKTRGIISKNFMLQMTFKAFNDIAGPNGLVPTLLVFSVNLRIVIDYTSSVSPQQEANAMTLTIRELHKLKAQCRV